MGLSKEQSKWLQYFYDFLMEHDAYYKFVEEVRKQNGHGIRHCPIDNAITWDKTSQGHSYWDDLNDECHYNPSFNNMPAHKFVDYLEQFNIPKEILLIESLKEY